MAAYLKVLAAVVAVVGILMGIAFVQRATGDEGFRRARLMRDRNPGNVLFESEFRVAEARRIFILYSAVGCFLTGVIGGSLLWGVGSLHGKIDRGRLAARPDSTAPPG